MENIKTKLGKRIRELRKRRNLTQEKLAELAGIETPSLSNIENGKNYPNHETLEKLSKALNVKVYELYIFDYYRSKKELIEEMNYYMEKDDILTQKMYKFFICIK